MKKFPILKKKRHLAIPSLPLWRGLGVMLERRLVAYDFVNTRLCSLGGGGVESSSEVSIMMRKDVELQKKKNFFQDSKNSPIYLTI